MEWYHWVIFIWVAIIGVMIGIGSMANFYRYPKSDQISDFGNCAGCLAHPEYRHAPACPYKDKF